jgi:parallel beta-helix repeat protein
MIKKLFLTSTFLFALPFITNGQTVYNETQSTDGTVIQTMVDAADPGDILRLEGPSGGTSNTFIENVTIDKALTIYGVSSSTIVIDGDGTGNPITVNASDVTIRDLTVTNAFPDSDSAGVRVNLGYSDILIDGVIAASSTSAGIHVTSGDAIIRNCIVSDNIWGVRIDFDSNFVIDNCQIYDNNRQDPENSAYGQGIRAVTVSSSTISNNVIYNNARQGILITEDGGDSFDITVNSNEIYSNGQNVTEGGIEVSTAEDIYLYENDVYNNAGPGINLAGTINSTIATSTLYGNTVSNLKMYISDNNDIYGNDFGTSTQDNIKVESSDGNDFDNNEVYSTQSDFYGLSLTGSGGSTLNSITNSIFRDNQNGIKIETDSATNTIANNQIYNTATYAIRVLAGWGNLIKSNNIYDNTRGIRIVTSGNTIYDNIFDNGANSYFSSGTNIWNVASTTLGPNILGGSYMGGNFWSNYGGADGDGDGFGDTPFDTGSGLDNLPLVSAVVTYKEVTYLTDGNGTVTGSSTQSVAIGDDAATVTAVPNSRY